MLQVPDGARILVLKLSSIGDIVMAMPVATALKRAFPASRITWAVQEPAADALRGHPAVDEVLLVRRPRGGGGRGAAFYVSEWRRLAPALRAGRFDVALDLQGLLKASVLGLLARAPRRLGFADERRELNRWINNVAVESAATHAVDRYLTMAEALGATSQPVEFGFPVSPQAEEWAEEFLASAGVSGQPVVAMIPLASDAHKCWPASRFGRLAGRLGQAGARCVIVGGPGQSPVGKAIADLAGHGTVSCAGRTDLPQLAALLRRCALVVGNDTGPLHIAVAVGSPVLGLYGPTDPEKVGPYGWTQQVLRHPADCGPCGRKPTCNDYPCMLAITLDEVADRAAAMLNLDF